MARKLIGVLALALALLPPASAATRPRLARLGWRRQALRAGRGAGALRGRRRTPPSGARRATRPAWISRVARACRTRQVVTFDGSVKDAIARLEDQPGVVDAQPNYIYHALAAAPNDTQFGHLWGMGGTPGVNVLPAWDRTRGAGQVIAVVDTGVDLTHPDLAGNLWTGPGGHGRLRRQRQRCRTTSTSTGRTWPAPRRRSPTTARAWRAWRRRRRSWPCARWTRRARGNSADIANGIAVRRGERRRRDQPQPRRARRRRRRGHGRGDRRRPSSTTPWWWRRPATRTTTTTQPDDAVHAAEREPHLRRRRDQDRRALRLLELRRDDRGRGRARRRRQRRDGDILSTKPGGTRVFSEDWEGGPGVDRDAHSGPRLGGRPAGAGGLTSAADSPAGQLRAEHRLAVLSTTPST